MESTEEREAVLRRRTKTHKSHGFFEPVEEKFSQHIRFADPLVNITTPQTIERFVPAIRVILRILICTVATISILGPALLLSSTAIRGVQLACHAGVLPPLSASICKEQPSSLYGISDGTTPLTTILEELGALNEMSASLEFLGLPLHTIVANLTMILSDLEKSMDVQQFKESENIGSIADKAHRLVESFSAHDNVFRQQVSIWEPYGIAALGEQLQNLTSATNTSDNLFLAVREGVYQTIPFLSKRSLSHSLVLHYHNLVTVNHLEEVKALVLASTETKLALLDLLGQVGILETQLQAVASTQADSLIMIRLATIWAHGVVQFAEDRYKSMYSKLHALSAPLAAEVASYDSWWLPRPAPLLLLPVPRLRALVETEQKQMAKLIAKAMQAQNVLDGLFENYLEDAEVSLNIRYRLEAAAIEGRLQWL